MKIIVHLYYRSKLTVLCLRLEANIIDDATKLETFKLILNLIISNNN